MAKINIEYDTKEKTLAVTMDGKKVNNVAQVGIYSYKNYDNEDESHIELTSLIPNEDEGMYEKHCIYANHEEKTAIKDTMGNDLKYIDKVVTGLSESLSKQLRVQ